MPEPAAPHHRFIKWTRETFNTGGHKAELLPLLERCTRELQAYPRYTDDSRYLRIWIQYVSARGALVVLGFRCRRAASLGHRRQQQAGLLWAGGASIHPAVARSSPLKGSRPALP